LLQFLFRLQFEKIITLFTYEIGILTAVKILTVVGFYGRSEEVYTQMIKKAVFSVSLVTYMTTDHVNKENQLYMLLTISN
jgi:hypothetical protein